MVESQPSKLLVASSILVSRSIRSLLDRAGVAQLVEPICNRPLASGVGHHENARPLDLEA